MFVRSTLIAGFRTHLPFSLPSARFFSSGASEGAPTIKILKTVDEVRKIRKEMTTQNMTLGFVPTMGSLHKGHLQLVDEASAHNDRVLVSIFVNPTQFAPNEDFKSYPRDLSGDVKKLSSLNSSDKQKIHYIFAPSTEEMYKKFHKTYVDLKGIDTLSEGKSRPGFFRGVATVVTKLFNAVQPDSAYFGQKDALQSVVVRTICRELNIPVEVHIVPTIREADGLASSSRNVYLTPEERKIAPVVYKSLRALEKQFQEGESHIHCLKDAVTQTLLKEPSVKLDYLSVFDTNTGEEIQEQLEFRPGSSYFCAIAVKLGKVRLLDNILLRDKKPSSAQHTDTCTH